MPQESRGDHHVLDLTPEIVQTDHDPGHWQGYVQLAVSHHRAAAFANYDASIQWVRADLREPNGWPVTTSGTTQKHRFVLGARGQANGQYRIEFWYTDLTNATAITAEVEGAYSVTCMIPPCPENTNPCPALYCLTQKKR